MSVERASASSFRGLQRPAVPAVSVLLVLGLALSEGLALVFGWPWTVPAVWLGVSLVLGWLLLARKGSVVKAARKGLSRLPVLRAQEVQRIGALLGACDRTCGRCSHFDRESGKRMQEDRSAFAMVMNHLTPGQMEATHQKPWNEASGFDGRTGQPLAIGGTTWNQLGVCRVDATPIGVFEPDSCTRWK